MVQLKACFDILQNLKFLISPIVSAIIIKTEKLEEKYGGLKVNNIKMQ